MSADKNDHGWDLRESGPANADHTVLLLPGGFCYLVLSGRLEFKLDDEVVELGPLTAVRVAPHTARSVWNAGPEEAVLMISSTRVEDLSGDVEIVEDFWSAA